MSDPSARTFTGDFRRFFLRGLVVLLPSVLTLWIVVKAYQFIDNTIAEPINRGVRVTLVNVARVWEPLKDVFDPSAEALRSELDALQAAGTTSPNPELVRARLRQENIRQWWNDQWFMDLIGILVAIIAVYVAGRLVGGFVGRQMYRRVERFITTLPIFKQVYPYVKQVVDFLFSDDKPIQFHRVVAAEYPRKGIWSVGFLTGGTLRTIRDRVGESVTVFIPSSPTPFTGYTITVKREDVIELPLTVEEAIRFAVSGGVLVPEHQQSDVPDQEPALTGRNKEMPSGLRPLPGQEESGSSGPAPAPPGPSEGDAG